MTIHDNEVLFYTGKDVQMEFELTNQVITDGQEFDKKTLFTLEAIDEEKSIWKLTIKAGRKGSSDVATKLAKKCRDTRLLQQTAQIMPICQMN